MEIEIKRTRRQRLFGLATSKIINSSKPTEEREVKVGNPRETLITCKELE